MNIDNNEIFAVLMIFIITLGIIFFLNVTVRYMGRITRFEMVIIIIIMGFSFGYLVSLISYQQSLPSIRDLKRQTDLQLIADSLDSYLKTNSYSERIINTVPRCPKTEYIGTDLGAINLVDVLEDEYMSEMPIDPFARSTKNTYYTICINDNLRIEVKAPKSEESDVISVIK